jgi:1-acyl-sn-glycerol-3-phosphate acyltransferase
MCIYPEGTRNRTDLPLKEFHDGAFKLAKETGVPILPALIFNTKKILPPGKAFYFWPSYMEIHFLPPVLVSKDDDYESLKVKIHDMMSRYYAEHINIL